jgi:hypothetical protein
VFPALAIPRLLGCRLGMFNRIGQSLPRYMRRITSCAGFAIDGVHGVLAISNSALPIGDRSFRLFHSSMRVAVHSVTNSWISARIKINPLEA